MLDWLFIWLFKPRAYSNAAIMGCAMVFYWAGERFNRKDKE